MSFFNFVMEPNLLPSFTYSCLFYVYSPLSNLFRAFDLGATFIGRFITRTHLYIKNGFTQDHEYFSAFFLMMIKTAS